MTELWRPDENANVCIREGSVWLLSTDSTWYEAFKGEPDEPPDILYKRWRDLTLDAATDEALKIERQKINNLLAWIIPIILLALAVLISSLTN